jgi:hypothetical protein
MTGYFAKLAARATQLAVKAPVGMPSRKVYNPFEDSAPAPGPLPSTEHAENEPMTRENEGFAQSLRSRTVQAESRPRRSQTFEQQKPEAGDDSARPRPSTAVQIEPFQRVLDSNPGGEEPHPSRPLSTTRQETTSPQAHPSRVGLLDQDQPPESTTVRATPKRPNEGTQHREAEQPSKDEQPIQMEEQSILLSKADDFMRRLTEHWRAPETASRDGFEGGSERIPTTAPHRDESPRLHPTRAGEQVAERESPRPSLVIGKLTVEVLPPAPPSTASGQKVVVVRGARRGGSNILSSRRFGLGQF